MRDQEEERKSAFKLPTGHQLSQEERQKQVLEMQRVFEEDKKQKELKKRQEEQERENLRATSKAMLSQMKDAAEQQAAERR